MPDRVVMGGEDARVAGERFCRRCRHVIDLLARRPWWRESGILTGGAGELGHVGYGCSLTGRRTDELATCDRFEPGDPAGVKMVSG